MSDEEYVNNVLPKGWKIETLNNVAKIVSGFAFKSSDFASEGIPVIKISNIGYSEFIWKDQQFLSKDFLKTNPDFVIKGGNLLLALTRPITNNTTKICRYPKSEIEGLLNQRVACIKECKISEDYLFWYFQTNFFKEFIRSNFSETLQPNLSPKDLALTPIPICSLRDQNAIVSKIEELLSDLDNGKQQLLTAQQQLKIYRQSLLKWAFEGKLTNKNVKEGELPKEWKWEKLDAVGKLFCGQSSPVSEVNKIGNGTLYVTGPEQWNGKNIEKTKWTNNPKRIVPDGAIFITVKGAGVGKLFPGISCAIGRDVYAYLPSKELNYKYSYYAIKHSIDLVIVKAQGDIPGLSKSHILEHEIGICSIEEQRCIVDEIESKLTVCDKIEETISQSLLQAETLRQSILKRAFEGKLVSLNYDSDNITEIRSFN